MIITWRTPGPLIGNELIRLWSRITGRHLDAGLQAQIEHRNEAAPGREKAAQIIDIGTLGCRRDVVGRMSWPAKHRATKARRSRFQRPAKLWQ